MTDLIARLEELEKAATPGPWTETGDPHLCCDCSGSLDTGANVAIVLELRNNLPAILRALKVQEAAEEWELAREKFMDGVAVGLVEQNVTDRLVETEAALSRAVKGEQP